MKKKLAAVVLSMVLCLGASVTTLAAGSPSANNSNITDNHYHYNSYNHYSSNRSKSRAESNHTGCIERCSERKIKWIFHRYGSN